MLFYVNYGTHTHTHIGALAFPLEQNIPFHLIWKRYHAELINLTCAGTICAALDEFKVMSSQMCE